LGVFIVDFAAAGLSLTEQRLTNDEPVGHLRLEGVRVADEDLLGDPRSGREIVEWMVGRTVLAVCALSLGVAEGALFMTANYVGQRQQFGVPIGSFQAVSQRAGDAYIDVEAMKVSLWQAAWALEEGREGADRALAIAKFWASEGGHRVAAAAQHLHGGMGFDRDYPLHRYFLTAKRLEFTLGGASTHLAALGEMIAREARQ
jgi:alkylation response protein AidB-like acyl-CoA dehydrogenase